MRLPTVLAGAVVMGGLLVGVPAPAMADEVPCSASDLVSAVATVDAGGGGTLDLSSGCTYTLTAPNAGENGLPPITTSIVINGNGATITRASATAFRFFQVHGGGDLTVNDITLSNGRATIGGAILNDSGATLTVASSTLTGNTGTSLGGGAILNYGTADINGSTLSDNTGTQGGALNSQLGSTTTVRSGEITGNHAVGGIGPAAGGAVSVLGSVTLNGTRVIGNDATGPGAFGGGIASGNTVSLTGGEVSGNVAEGASADGGGIWAMGTLDLTNNPVTDNTATGDGATGGGIFSSGTTSLTNSPVSENSALGSGATGGGIFRAGGTVTLESSTVAPNEPDNCGNPSTVPDCR